MIRLPRRGAPETAGRWWPDDVMSVTVHPFFRPDWKLDSTFVTPLGSYRAQTDAEEYMPGDNRTKHSTTLGAAVGETVEALG